jgi:hypothetical protein
LAGAIALGIHDACIADRNGYLRSMSDDPLFLLAAFACLAVLAVLLVGVGGFARGGDFNRKHANKIMRLRLLLQFVAVVLIVTFVYFSRRGG